MKTLYVLLKVVKNEELTLANMMIVAGIVAGRIDKYIDLDR